jgi:hypothetical protein
LENADLSGQVNPLKSKLTSESLNQLIKEGYTENSFDILNKSIWKFEKEDDVSAFKEKFKELKEKESNSRRTKGVVNNCQMAAPDNFKPVSILTILFIKNIFLISLNILGVS